MAEDVVERVLHALHVVDDIFIEHRALCHLACFELVDLVTNEMHGVDLTIDRSLGLGYVIAESQVWVILEGPSCTTLVASIVNDDARPVLD